MKPNDLNQIKLTILDKRIDSFINGYRQNVAIFAHDEEEVSHLLDAYLGGKTIPSTKIVRTCAAHTDRKMFFKHVIYSLLGDLPCADLDGLINTAAGTLPKTIATIKQALQKASIDFLDLTETINTFITESNLRCLWVIEQFHEMQELFPCCFEDFAKFIILQRQCMVTLATSSEKASAKIISTELNLLFGNFEKIDLSDGLFTENCHHIKGRLAPIVPSDFMTTFLEDILDGNTLYYQHVLANFSHNTQKTEESLLLDNINKTLYNKQTYLHQKFLRNIAVINETHKIPQATLRILSAICEGYLRKQELASLNICDNRSLEGRLIKLCEQGYIINNGTIYKVRDRLFGFWAANIFKYYLNICDDRVRLKAYTDNMKNYISAYALGTRKNGVAVMLDLLQSFKNDTISLGKDNYRLCAMAKTKIVSDDAETKIMVGEGKEIIFMGVKEGPAQDSDIFSFAEKSDRIKGKGIKKVFVSFGNMSDTVRLAAKNHKLISWDINEVNQLLKIYNKPLLPSGNK